ncbi:Uncharacterized protein MLTONO_0469 [Mesorhizobium loti]|nr:Uncharacterized protein MLTONO_0469 [Mesorhizobium loti]
MLFWTDSAARRSHLGSVSGIRRKTGSESFVESWLSTGRRPKPRECRGTLHTGPGARMPVRKKSDRRKNGIPVDALRRIWVLWLLNERTPGEDEECAQLEAECQAAGYDPLLAWCSSQE